MSLRSLAYGTFISAGCWAGLFLAAYIAWGYIR